MNFPIDIFLKRKTHCDLSTLVTILTTFDFIGVTLVTKEAQYFVNNLVVTMYTNAYKMLQAADSW